MYLNNRSRSFSFFLARSSNIGNRVDKTVTEEDEKQPEENDDGRDGDAMAGNRPVIEAQ